MTLTIKNLTTLPNLRFVSSDNQGREFGVFMVKAAYDIDSVGLGILSEEQEPFFFTDNHYGALNVTSVRAPSDLVGYKPQTDVICNATAYAPDGKAATSWLVGARICDEKGRFVEKKLRIYGPRYWLPKWKRNLTEQEKNNWRNHMDLFECWELSEPQPITSLPIRYEYAYGGIMPKGVDENGRAILQAYEYNPIGRGWIDKKWTDHIKPVAAPQIEDADIPITDPYKCYEPAGFGAVPSAWLPRRPLGGTYDQNWVNNIWPNWPLNYDFAYNNSAATRLKSDFFLSEDIEVVLVGLHPTQRMQTIKLKNPVPTMSLGIGYQWDTVILNLDTIYIDCEENRILCTWRSVFEQYKYEALVLRLAREHYHVRYPLFKSIFASNIKPEDVALEVNYE